MSFVTRPSDEELAHVTEMSDALFRASKNVRILTHLAWPLGLKREFFRKKAQKLPEPVYPAFKVERVTPWLQKLNRLKRDTAIDEWIAKKAKAIELSARMLEHAGQRDFFKFSKELYGLPKSTLVDESSTPLQLAQSFGEILSHTRNVDLGAPPEACILADALAEEMDKASKKMFGDLSPPVSVVNRLSANALAGTKRIRIRRGAHFTDLDVKQLIQHEAFVHVATGLNGLQQPVLKFLGCNSATSTKTQEGLAVFAELITGCIDLDRMRRLADRVIAIQMAIDGADFIEVYRYFLEQTDNPDQSFENSRRVFRGGVLKGGAPFTKDVVYIDGMLRVHNFLRALVTSGRADCLRLLFCGKLDLEDIPMLGWLTASGFCRPAKFLPPWATDLRFLLCYLAYSAFLNQIQFGKVKKHYQKMLTDVPVIPMSGLSEKAG